MTIALVDGDLVAYINAASAENYTEEDAVDRAGIQMDNILFSVGADQYKVFLSGSTNFRYSINPAYKANRKDMVRPSHLQACREYLVTEWGATVTDGYEADDALAMAQTEETVICSIDKDMLQIPGKHYSWPIYRKGVVIREAFFTEVSELEGIKFLYKQMLIGDSSDNVLGIKGIGKVGAAKLIDHLLTEKECFDVVVNLYADPERFLMNANCLWLMREEGVTFESTSRM